MSSKNYDLEYYDKHTNLDFHFLYLHKVKKSIAKQHRKFVIKLMDFNKHSGFRIGVYNRFNIILVLLCMFSVFMENREIQVKATEPNRSGQFMPYIPPIKRELSEVFTGSTMRNLYTEKKPVYLSILHIKVLYAQFE